MAKKTYFVTGTDTGVGKTIAAAAILEAAKAAGKRTLAMKPIASGCDQTGEGLRNEDALMLQAAMTEDVAYDTINPIALEPAIAPHVAAEQAGKLLTAQRLIGFCRGLQIRPADLMLIEGAGGWRVPLNDRESYSAVPRELGLDVILVVPLKLGCINHALLTAEAIRADGLFVAGWVGNHPEAEAMSCEQETLNYLSVHLGAACLGVLPWMESTSTARLPEMLAGYLNIKPLIEI
ncbi:dethiobiotin synthase [Marinobacter halophilus]|uniref:ATP-dependent dethiobiotin synthetase BioD n=1 Tax=Marinobacter halophilus TaxID=1323740 RepID=A0A2T1KEB5_9GAMM|nr:dethiobiotin synthase [Marinobacter halophilus]PSF07882.1 dethiobiotin synthase [Marinobacter halophilus]GGC57902.1 ATP-dependent dethiobiotin synthetase BioD [Marinobacter halophilus]